MSLTFSHQTSETTAIFLSHLLCCYPCQPILLLWDRARWHRGTAVQSVLQENPRLQTVFFPPASPDLNPQEHVWSLARAAVSHNHNFIRFDLLVKAFLDDLSKTLFHFNWLDKYAPPILCQS